MAALVSSPWLWVLLTLWAVCMQTLRTGLQKHLKNHLDDLGVTWTRYGLAAPLALLLLVLLQQSGLWVQPSWLFVLYCLAGGVAQIVATALLIELFSYRQFAVSTMLSKTEAVQIAILGVLFFAEPLSLTGMIGVAVGAVGLVLMLLGDSRLTPAGLTQALSGRVAAVGVLSGTLFALTALFIRRAVLELPGASALIGASATLSVMVLMQTLLLGLWLVWYRPDSYARMLRVPGRCAAVGASSFFGSFGWFAAFALTHPAYVKTLGQIELLLAVLVGMLYFGERINWRESLGMLAVAIGAVVLFWA